MTQILLYKNWQIQFFKINVIQNGLEKYISLNIHNKLVFTDNFQCLRSSLDIIRYYFFT